METLHNTETRVFTGESQGKKIETTITVKVLEGDVNNLFFERMFNAIVMGGFTYGNKNRKWL